MGFELGTLRIEQLSVGFGRAKRLFLRQQEIAGKAVAHTHDVAHLAEFLDAF
jgi:hypothetical protein